MIQRTLKIKNFKLDKAPIIIKTQVVDYLLLLEHYKLIYKKTIRPIKRKRPETEPEKHVKCPRYEAPYNYIYKNNGKKGQYECKVWDHHVNLLVLKELMLRCPHCNHTLEKKKSRKYFNIHKCVNAKCSYYLQQVKKFPADTPAKESHKFKLHYIFCEFVIDFFEMDLHAVSTKTVGFNFKKFQSISFISNFTLPLI